MSRTEFVNKKFHIEDYNNFQLANDFDLKVAGSQIVTHGNQEYSLVAKLERRHHVIIFIFRCIIGALLFLPSYCCSYTRKWIHEPFSRKETLLVFENCVLQKKNQEIKNQESTESEKIEEPNISTIKNQVVQKSIEEKKVIIDEKKEEVTKEEIAKEEKIEILTENNFDSEISNEEEIVEELSEEQKKEKERIAKLHNILDDATMKCVNNIIEKYNFNEMNPTVENKINSNQEDNFSTNNDEMIKILPEEKELNFTETMPISNDDNNLMATDNNDEDRELSPEEKKGFAEFFGEIMAVYLNNQFLKSVVDDQKNNFNINNNESDNDE